MKSTSRTEHVSDATCYDGQSSDEYSFMILLANYQVKLLLNNAYSILNVKKEFQYHFRKRIKFSAHAKENL